MENINLDMAQRIISGAEKEASKIGIQMVISIVDNGGNLIATHRMGDAWIASIDIAPNKAWTSVALKMATSDLAEATVPKEGFWVLNATNDGKLVALGGGSHV